MRDFPSIVLHSHVRARYIGVSKVRCKGQGNLDELRSIPGGERGEPVLDDGFGTLG